jgi:cytochrome c-type biogenesis protein CcmH/NrfG
MNPDNPDEFDAISNLFPWLFGAFAVLFVCVVALIVVTTVRNRRVLRQAGIDPNTVGSQLAVRLLRGQSRTPIPASDRLAELADLRDRGLITAEEYQARRSHIIDGV